MKKRPNILLFMVDQLTAFVLSTYGGTVRKTPRTDRPKPPQNGRHFSALQVFTPVRTVRTAHVFAPILNAKVALHEAKFTAHETKSRELLAHPNNWIQAPNQIH